MDTTHTEMPENTGDLARESHDAAVEQRSRPSEEVPFPSRNPEPPKPEPEPKR